MTLARALSRPARLVALAIVGGGALGFTTFWVVVAWLLLWGTP
jgi:hypothetical protein